MTEIECIKKMTCRKSGSPMPCDDCTPRVHPRQAEILKNNYRVFISRAQRTDNWDYKADCIKAADAAAMEYQNITGKSVLDAE